MKKVIKLVKVRVREFYITKVQQRLFRFGVRIKNVFSKVFKFIGNIDIPDFVFYLFILSAIFVEMALWLKLLFLALGIEKVIKIVFNDFGLLITRRRK